MNRKEYIRQNYTILGHLCKDREFIFVRMKQGYNHKQKLKKAEIGQYLKSYTKDGWKLLNIENFTLLTSSLEDIDLNNRKPSEVKIYTFLFKRDEIEYALSFTNIENIGISTKNYKKFINPMIEDGYELTNYNVEIIKIRGYRDEY